MTTPKRSLAEKVAQHFVEHPNTWIRAEVFMGIGGRCAWRTRISDCRKKLGMTIENRTQTVINEDGSRYTTSEYMYVPITLPKAEAVGASPT